ncbi:MAG: endonuclease/exonuclease/phosphatase family protein [Ferruginibacter sp.]|nr:endonuclease/exonuclease/phosphatase family protein [Ferruginibacter sp.]
MRAALAKHFGTTFKAINIFIVLVYLLACLIPILPAGEFWMISVLGLGFPVLALVVAFFSIGWLMVRSKWFLLSLVALVLSWQQLSAIAGLNAKRTFTLSKPKETLRVLTWNVSSWGETNKSPVNKFENPVLMIDLIRKQQADVICLQECWDKKNQRSKYGKLQELKDMGYCYSYFVKTVKENVNYKSGVAILSKYPITDTAKFSYGKDDFAEHLIYADVQFNQQKIRVFTTHLQSVRFDEAEYTALRKIKRTDETGLKDSRTIVRKLRDAYEFRATEAELVQQKLKESPYPVIICGDFNDVPNSYTYFTIKGDLQDAFLKKGTGLGRTFQYLSPTLRIDYILVDKNYKVKQYNRIKVPYSDHYPVIADLRFFPNHDVK